MCAYAAAHVGSTACPGKRSNPVSSSEYLRLLVLISELIVLRVLSCVIALTVGSALTLYVIAAVIVLAV